MKLTEKHEFALLGQRLFFRVGTEWYEAPPRPREARVEVG